MSCRSTRDRISGFLDARLDPGTATRFTDHVRSCPDCAALLDKARAADRMLWSSSIPMPPADLADSILAAVRAAAAAAPADARAAEHASVAAGWRFLFAGRLASGLAACAAALVVVAVGAYAGLSFHEWSSASTQAAAAPTSGSGSAWLVQDAFDLDPEGSAESLILALADGKEVTR